MRTTDIDYKKILNGKLYISVQRPPQQIRIWRAVVAAKISPPNFNKIRI
jgi:hypothetical protein